MTEFTKKAKVLELIRSAEGGMKEHYLCITKALKEHGFDVIAFCNFDAQTMEDLKMKGIRIQPYDLPGAIKPVSDMKRIWVLIKFLKKEKVQLLHCHGFKAGLIGRMAAFIAGCRTLYTVHNFILSNTRGKITGRIVKWLEYIFCLKTDRIITVSKALKKELVDTIGVSPQKIDVIYNGIEIAHQTTEENIREKWHIGSDFLLLGTVARLIPSKGIDCLLDALDLIPKEIHFVLMVIGSGPDSERLKQRAKEKVDKGQVIFTGYVEPIQAYYRAMDIFVLPSLSEGLGISILEAMAASKPVIATKVGGIPELVQDQYNGLLVSPGESRELAAAIVKLARDPQLRCLYGKRAFEFVKTFSKQKMVDETVSVIQGLLGQQRRS